MIACFHGMETVFSPQYKSRLIRLKTFLDIYQKRSYRKVRSLRPVPVRTADTENKKDRQEWKPLNSLNTHLVAGPGIEPGTS